MKKNNAAVAPQTIVTPTFYKNFQCIADKCEDNCCYGWNIFIDKNTYQFMTKKSVFKYEAKEIFQRTKGNHSYAIIRLDEEGFCTLRDENGLCRVHKEHGPERLSNTCRIYPRLEHVRGNQIQHSLSLSCPEVARKVLLDPEAMQFDFSTTLKKGYVAPVYNPPWYVDVVRDLFLQLLGDESMPLDKRLFTLGMMLNRLESIDTTQDDQQSALVQVIDHVVFGEMGAYFDNMPATTAFNVECLLKALNAQFAWSVLKDKAQSHRRYEQLRERIALGLENAGDDKPLQVQRFIQGVKTSYLDFVKAQPTVWVNFFIYQMYNTDFPSEKPATQFRAMLMDYIYLRGVLGLIGAGKALDTDDLSLVVSSYYRCRQHGSRINQIYAGLSKKMGIDEAMLPLLLLKVADN